MLKSLATDTGVSAADLIRQLVRHRWAEVGQRQKLEQLAFASLAEMVNRDGVACAVVFASRGRISGPRNGPDFGPQPIASNILQAPTIGDVVAQGFAYSLSEAEKASVQARFPSGAVATWLFNT